MSGYSDTSLRPHDGRNREREAMQTNAIVLREPLRIGLETLDLAVPSRADAVVDVAFSGISTGTERLLYTGRMPPFPGMGYPLVPGYESVGRRWCQAGPQSGARGGRHRVRAGCAAASATCAGLFGGAASRVVVPGCQSPDGGRRERLGERATLLALAATAAARHCHAPDGTLPGTDRRPRRARPARSPASWWPQAGTRAAGVGDQRRPAMPAAEGYVSDAAGRRPAARLPRDLRRERRLPTSSTRS